MTDDPQAEGKKKQISIRGMDENLYRRISAMARELGVNVGLIVNQALKTYLSLPPEKRYAHRKEILRAAVKFPVEFASGVLESNGMSDSKSIVISEIGSLTVSKSDLENSDKKISFINIKRLEFEEDVDEELFNSKVKSIVYCDELVIPRSLWKLAILSKCRRIEKIVKK